MTKKKNTRVMTTSDDVITALRNKYTTPEYALLTQVANTTGYGSYRWADAIVMGLWPSRNYEIIGFEVKVSRTDWVRELKNPAKADKIATYCDSWYLVLGDENILRLGELPLGWGLMVPHTKSSLKIVRKSSMRKPKPLDKQFLAAILRKACTQITEESRLHNEYSRGYDEGIIEGKERKEYAIENRDGEIKQLKKNIKDFETASGVNIIDWRHESSEIGNAVKMVLDGSYMRELENLEGLYKRAQNCAKSIGEEIEKHKSNKI